MSPKAVRGVSDANRDKVLERPFRHELEHGPSEFNAAWQNEPKQTRLLRHNMYVLRHTFCQRLLFPRGSQGAGR